MKMQDNHFKKLHINIKKELTWVAHEIIATYGHQKLYVPILFS